MLLAAGEGKRMLPLTKSTPKPLLKIGSTTLIERHLTRLAELGFKNIVINLAHLGDLIRAAVGNGEQFGLTIRYSDESAGGALETAGGLRQALPLIQSDPFLVVNADIWTDYDFTKLLTPLDKSGRLLMVTNPTHNQHGDFGVDDRQLIVEKDSRHSTTYTFAGIALYRQSIFRSITAGKQALAPIFHQLAAQKQLEASVYQGSWKDIGTPERLDEINQQIQQPK